MPSHLMQILFSWPSALLTASDLKEKCHVAAKARTACAIASVSAFFWMVAVLLGFSVFPFAWVPPMIAGGFLVFLGSTLLAYRFGRLCTAEIGPSRRTAIAHLRQVSPEIDAYYGKVKSQGRPFTRLDLDEIRRMA